MQWCCWTRWCSRTEYPRQKCILRDRQWNCIPRWPGSASLKAVFFTGWSPPDIMEKQVLRKVKINNYSAQWFHRRIGIVRPWNPPRTTPSFAHHTITRLSQNTVLPEKVFRPFCRLADSNFQWKFCTHSLKIEAKNGSIFFCAHAKNKFSNNVHEQH